MQDMTIKQIAEEMGLPIFTAQVLAAAKGMPSDFDAELDEDNRKGLVQEIEDRRMAGGGFTINEITCGVILVAAPWLTKVLPDILADEDEAPSPDLAGCEMIFRKLCESAMASKDNRPSSFIYFVQEGADGPIKIGTTQNLKTRLSSLQTGSARKLRVLGTIRGGNALEALLHQEFAEYQISGEWFQPGQILLKFIAEEFGGYEIAEKS